MSVFTIQHFSDTHADATATRATLALMNQYPADARIHTGDAVKGYFEQDYSYLSPYNFMIVVGNHDYLLRWGTEHFVHSGTDWSQQPTQQQAYEKFILPTLGNYPISIEAGKTYWYKDYEEQGIRLIGLNNCLMGDEYQTQIAWYENLLTECLEQKLKVAVAVHMPPFDVQATRCCFTDEMNIPDLTAGTQLFYQEFYPGVKGPYDLLCTYADKGVEVLCYLAGHEHGDGLFKAGNQKKFPMIMVSAVIVDGWCNLSRSKDPNSLACPLFNQYEYDSNLNTLRIRRMGANCRRNGDLCKLAIWDYGVSDFINFYSRRL